MRWRFPDVEAFNRDTRLLIVISTISSFSYLGLQQLLRVLYVLRLGHGPEYVGFVGASAALTYMAVSIPCGALGQRFSARVVMGIGGLLIVVGMILFPLAEFTPMEIAAAWPLGMQVLMTVGWATLNVNGIPVLMAVTTKEHRSKAYAVNNAAKNLGTLLGSLLGGLLPGWFAAGLGQGLDQTAPYRYGLWVGAALALVALLPIALLRQDNRRMSSQRPDIQEPFPTLLVMLLMIYVYLSHTSFAACQAFGSAYMDTDLQLSASSIGLFTGVAQGVAVLAALLTPRLIARRGSHWFLVTTTLGMALSLLPMAFVRHWATAGMARVGVMAMQAMWLPALQVFQMGQVGTRWQSLVYGILSTAMGLGFGSISLAGGYIIAASSYRNVFLLGAGLSAIGATLMGGIAWWRDRQAVTTKTARTPSKIQANG